MHAQRHRQNVSNGYDKQERREIWMNFIARFSLPLVWKAEQREWAADWVLVDWIGMALVKSKLVKLDEGNQFQRNQKRTDGQEKRATEQTTI